MRGPLEIVRHLLRGQVLLFRRGGHLMREPRQIFGLAGDAVDGGDGCGNIGADRGYLGLNLRRCRGRLLGQLAHLAGHHGETLAVHARPRGLDVGIQRQHAGLRGDGGDQVRHLGHAAAGGAQALDRSLAFRAGVARLLGCLRHIRGVPGNLRDAGFDLVRGRGHHLQIAVQMLDVGALRFLRLAAARRSSAAC